MSGDLKDMRAYSRGYEDGRRSKDADHAAVVLKLSRLTFNGNHHENLSKIAYAVYPCATGWTCESSEGLRDRLIDLLGGVHDHCDTGRGFACGDPNPRDVGEPAEAMTYDVLGNERHEAVCRLREWEPDEDGMPRRELWEAVMGEELPTVPLKGDAELDIIMRDRLIHLLGGDQPAESFGSYISRKSVDAMSSRAEGQSQDDTHMHINLKANTYAYQILELADALGVSYEVGTSVSDIGNAVIARARQLTDECNFSTPENDMDAEDAKPNPAETSEDASDHVSFGTPSITDEFREAIETATKTYEGSWYEMNDADHTICHITEGELLGIADRIEEQFARVCELWERTATDTAQSVHDDMEAECNKLQAECDRLTAALDELHADPANDVICRLERERDDLLELLKDAVTEYQLSQNGWSYGAVVSQAISLELERDELRAKLEEADAAIVNWRVREKSFEEFEHERDQLRRSLRQIAERAGVPHDRDLSEYGDEKIANAVIGQLGDTNQYVKSLEWVRDRRLPRIEAERDELQKRLDEMREQREHWASEATKMYRLFFSHDEYCVPNSPSEMVSVAVRTLQEKCSDAESECRELQAKLDAIREALDGNH